MSGRMTARPWLATVMTAAALTTVVAACSSSGSSASGGSSVLSGTAAQLRDDPTLVQESYLGAIDEHERTTA